MSQTATIPRQENLCGACSTRFLHNRSKRFAFLRFGFHNRPWRQVSELKSDSCDLCWLLKDLIQEYYTRSQLQESWKVGKVIGDVVREESSLLRVGSELEHNYPVYRLNFINKDQLIFKGPTLFCITDPRIEMFSAIPSDSHTTGSPNSLNTISQWTESCSSNHELCRRAAARPESDILWNPTRLLHVRSSVGDSAMEVKLINTNTITEPIKYGTLSYCWGIEKFYTLTTANLATLNNNIHLKDLSRTFVDAFTVLRNIGLEYIWIDALCIVQDSLADWAYESTTMSRIYAYSSTTLSAAASDTSDGGLFKLQRKADQDLKNLEETFERYNVAAREASNMLARSLLHFDSLSGYEADDARRASGGISLQRKTPEKPAALFIDESNYAIRHICVRHNPWPIVMNSQPLFRRGWIFQERLLSPRIVHFSSDQIYWECAELCASEVNPNGGPWNSRKEDPKAEFTGIIKYQYYAAMLGVGPHPVPSSPDELIGLWLVLVKEYSRCKLTYEEDKLVAFSAVAARFWQLLEDDQYVAGLWVSKLPQLLLWTCAQLVYGTASSSNSENHDIIRRTKSYQAPTWSWASMHECEINNHFMLKLLNETANDESKICISILGTTTRLVNTNLPTGAISMCELLLQGRLCLASTNSSSFPGLLFHTKSLGYDSDRYMGKSRPYGSHRFDEGFNLLDRKNIFCLEIATTSWDRSSRGRQGENSLVHGLMLCFTEIRGQYRRVGDFSLDLNYLQRTEKDGEFCSRDTLGG